MTAVGVIFADGSICTARTWGELEAQLRDSSWNPSDKGDFREEMAWRAWQWSKTAVEAGTEVTSRRFFEQLEDAGMLRIVEGE